MGFSNPALAASVSDKTIGVNYMNYMSGANMGSATFNRVINDKMTWAVGGEFINYGSIKEVDENNVQTELSQPMILQSVVRSLIYC